MKAKSSAHYQREYRKRLREQGLIKKEVWVLPQHSKTLSKLEMKLRTAEGLKQQLGEEPMKGVTKSWTTVELLKELKEQALFRTGQARIELINGIEPSLLIEMREFGDLPVYLSVVGDQIIVECVLWSIEDVVDKASFNEAVLKTHKYFPLSTICLESVKGHPDHYHMFGALSASSLISNVILEIEVLASNVIQATEAYSEFLNLSAEVTA